MTLFLWMPSEENPRELLFPPIQVGVSLYIHVLQYILYYIFPLYWTFLFGFPNYHGQQNKILFASISFVLPAKLQSVVIDRIYICFNLSFLHIICAARLHHTCRSFWIPRLGNHENELRYSSDLVSSWMLKQFRRLVSLVTSSQIFVRGAMRIQLCFCVSPVVADVCRPRRFPPWCGRAALWGSWAAIALANSVSIWAAHGFNQKVAMMWLISCFASFLCSCLLLEPIKVRRKMWTL